MPVTLPAEFVIPGAKTETLNANHRLHWRVVRRRTAYWRQLTAVVVQASQGRPQPLPDRVRIVATISYPDRRRRDVGNLAPTVKAIVDGLTDAGVLADDDDLHVLGPDIRRGHGPFAITIRLEPLGTEAAA